VTSGHIDVMSRIVTSKYALLNRYSEQAVSQIKLPLISELNNKPGVLTKGDYLSK
jgi:hypothetical protein